MAEYKKLTLDGLKELITDLEKAPRPKYTMQMAASDYPMLSDEEFIALCNTENIHFLGGVEGVRKMRARMSKLKIPY
jgi:hypothetical protein